MEFQTKKSLGQNFLQDDNIIRKIVHTASIDNDCNVLEIGPGLGALTDFLIEKANKVLSVEIDQRLISILEEKYSNKENFKLLNKDFLETQKEDFEWIQSKKIKMVANLPYYITSPIILKTLLDYDFVDELYVMVQKEVALRYVSEYRNKTYSSITVFLQTIADVKYEFTVKNTVFKPVPKVDSSIISLKRKSDLKTMDFIKYEKFLKACFKQKRKLLSNNLSQSYNINKNDIILFLENLGYTKTIRPEEITVKEYLDLYNAFFNEFSV